MNAFDFVFGTTKHKDVAKSIIELGYVTPDEISELKRISQTKTFLALTRLLVVLSDREGRNEKRMEDAYAKFPMDLIQFIGKLDKEIQRK